MHRTAKETAIVDVKGILKDVMSVVLVDFRGTDVPTVTEIRDEFRAANCGYQVVKNTIVKLAIKDTDLEPMSTLLAGPTAVIWSTDSPSVAAKIAVQRAKDLKTFTVKGGFFEGQALDAEGVERLSKMPGKEELQASLLMTFIAAPQQLVATLAAGPMNFLYLLQARERQQGEG